jgi:putative transposase
MHRAIKVRLYPTAKQATQLDQVMGCARWWYNFALNLCNQTYKETGQGMSRSAINSYLPKLKKEEETKWLADCYSQVLQAATLNLTKAFKNFFDKRAKFPKFKSFHDRQSASYPQNVKIIGDSLQIPKIGLVKAKIHRVFEGDLKTVTISRVPSGAYYASLLFETDEAFPSIVTEGKVIGIDLGLKDFAITHDGEKTSKYSNPKHLTKHQKNLARKQAKLARKQKGSKSRDKAKKLVAKVYARISKCDSFSRNLEIRG